jgi:hypothetical protein
MTWIFGDEQYRVRVTRPDGGVDYLTNTANHPTDAWQGTRTEAEELVTERRRVYEQQGFRYAIERVT